MIIAKNITKSFKNLQVLKGANLHIKKGEIVSIVGTSGAGKTTLLQIIGTLVKPNSGTIIINNNKVSHLKGNQLSKFRNSRIGFIFQFHNLLPEFTALENVSIPALIAKTPKKEVEEHAKEIFSFLNLSDRVNHKPAQLSGGEQQRVAIARALINNPDVILADEPSGNLDYESQQELYKLFFKLREKYNQTFTIVTHDKHLASISDRKLTMKNGVIV